MAVAPVPEERLGFLRSCLVEGDSVQEARVRRNKQRALLVSIIVQILIVAALVLFPLLSRGERITVRGDFTPLPPPGRLGNRSHDPATHRHPATRSPECRFCAPTHISPVIVDHVPSFPQPIANDNFDSEMSRYGSPNGSQNGIAYSDREAGPPPPTETRKSPEHPPRIHVGSIEPAMLIHRIEPVYPLLAKQLRREGRVELHAVIATDGSIQSLEVSGDPLFIQSSLAAVREWRYRPTILNGQPFEVDTHITVVYTLAH
jgi:periplasmic protein TonB